MRFPTLGSIRVRLTLWYILLLALILFAFCGILYIAMQNSLYDSLDESLENRSEALLRSVSYEGGDPTLGEADAEGNPEPGEDFVRLYDSSGEVIFDNSRGIADRADDGAAVSAALGGGTTVDETDGTEDRSYRTRIVPLRRGLEVVGALEVGFTTDDVEDTMRELRTIMMIVYPVTIAAAALSGAFLAGRTLSPIDRLTRLARRITAQDLSQRLDMDLPDDELGRLSRTFDEMIARLDESFQQQRQFTADASHELRTPLTAIKGQVEVALQRNRDPAAYRDVLTSVNREVDRMIRLISSLLTLARADAGHIPIQRETIELRDSLSSAVEHVRPLADEKGVHLDLAASPDSRLQADGDLLLQLWLNLLDNAIKHTPSGGTVKIGWAAESDVAVRITDTGPGIATEHLPHIFDRFYRADPARTRAEGGAGLGLSISRWIVEAHGGTIAARSDPGAGTEIVVSLPAGEGGTPGQ